MLSLWVQITFSFAWKGLQMPAFVCSLAFLAVEDCEEEYFETNPWNSSFILGKKHYNYSFVIWRESSMEQSWAAVAFITWLCELQVGKGNICKMSAFLFSSLSLYLCKIREDSNYMQKRKCFWTDSKIYTYLMLWFLSFLKLRRQDLRLHTQNYKKIQKNVKEKQIFIQGGILRSDIGVNTAAREITGSTKA